MSEADTIKGGAHAPVGHDSGARHVQGSAVYADDIPLPDDALEIAIGLSPSARGQVTRLDLTAVRAVPGVEVVLIADDIPGENDISPLGMNDDPVLAAGRVEFVGQAMFAVAARDRGVARRAARLAEILVEAEAPVLTMDQARSVGDTVTAPHALKRGDAAKAIAAAPRRLGGRITIGGQEHFYLEGQVAVAFPGEDDEITVVSSTQHPSEIQHAVAKVLGTRAHMVTVETRRMGGGFGGKETQGSLCAVLAAVVAKRTGRVAKCRLDRDDDFVLTGKRHDFEADYEVGFDDDGRIHGVKIAFASRCGVSADLSGSINDRALFHADNCYYFDHAELTNLPLRTNMVSATAFRGFGGPQGMVAGERVIEEIAFALGKDPLEIRKVNFYGEAGRDETPYFQTVEDNMAPEIVADLEVSADYAGRRAAIREYNAASTILKKGLALTPVKFGISFTAKHLNQAGALVHVYNDGSVYLNHGGTEMGQGLFTKVAQVVAEELQVDLDNVRISATSTAKVPNTSPTAASAGSDLNGMAAQAAAREIKGRLIDFAADNYGVTKDQVVFLPNRVRVGNQEIPFADLAKQAYMARVSLSAAGHYKTPKIHYDRETGRGRPFYYFAYGASVSEVTVDTLTGEYRVDRVDILHETGHSLNPTLDLGQVEGGFIQGMGWLTTEELWWDEKGVLWTHAPSTYKIPACSDRPPVFNVRLVENTKNREETVYRSKAVGEPPLMLAISVLHALSDAVASVEDHKVCPRLDPPATPEKVLAAIAALKNP